MKGLSLHQPWIWAVLHAGKHVENRPWAPPIGMIEQRIALHSTKGFDDDGLQYLWKLGIRTQDEYPRGAILGVATIDRVVTVNTTLAEDQKQWFFGEYGWLLKDVRALQRPIPCRGLQRLWTVPDAIVQDIHDQLSEAA